MKKLLDIILDLGLSALGYFLTSNLDTLIPDEQRLTL